MRYIDADKLKARIERQIESAAQKADISCSVDDFENEKKYDNERDVLERLLGLVSSLQQEQPNNEDVDKVAQELYEHLHELKRRNNIPTNLYDKQEIIDLWKAGIEYERNHPKQEQPDNMIQWTGNNLKEVIDFTGKSPKFGEWFNSWEEFENYVHTHNDILKLFCEDGSHYEVPVGAWIVKTPDGYNTPSCFRFVQKPADWSVEDENTIQEIVGCIEQARADSRLSEDHCLSLETFMYKHCRHHWKPSDEQLRPLEYAIDFFKKKRNDTAYLESLYNDLKKL